MMHRHRLILIVLVTALAVFTVVLFSLSRRQSTLDNDNLSPSEAALPEMEVEPLAQATKNNRVDSSANQKSRVSARPIIETSESTSLPAGDRATDLERERLAALFKGETPLSVAQKLREAGEWNYAQEYAQMAVAENPDSFEALLLLGKFLPHEGDERQALFRRLVEKDPTSVEALYGLGQTLRINNQPREAAFYLKAAIAKDPSDSTAHYVLGKSYEGMGRYDEALASYKKAYAISQGLVTLAYIRAIEAGNPLIKPLPSEAQEPGSKEHPTEGTLPQAPSQEETPPIPNKTEGLERESTFDDEPFLEPPESGGVAAQEAMEAEFQRLLDEYETSIGSESDPSATVKEQIADLERESKPKLSPDDDPDDERGRRKSESNQKRRERSTERSEDDEDGDDARADEDASEEDEER